MYPVFDTHTHTYPEQIASKATKALGEFYTFPVGGEGTYADLEKEYRPLGLKGMLLFCVATNPHQVPRVNDSVAALAALSRSQGYETVGFAGMHQDYPDFAGELDRCAEMGLRGVKLHPDIQGEYVDSEKFLPLYEEMEKRGMTLYLHVGDNRPRYRFSEAKRVRKIALSFPRLKIVAAHLGGYMAWDESPVLWGLDNVYYDCSSTLWALPNEESVRLIRGCGVDRVMYGSDYPVMSPARHLSLFLGLPLTEEEKQAILYGNAKRILSL